MTEQLGESVEGVNRILEAIGIGLGLKELAELADAYSNLKTRMTIAAGSAEKARRRRRRLRASRGEPRSALTMCLTLI
jgi:hypothetical protein